MRTTGTRAAYSMLTRARHRRRADAFARMATADLADKLEALQAMANAEPYDDGRDQLQALNPAERAVHDALLAELEGRLTDAIGAELETLCVTADAVVMVRTYVDIVVKAARANPSVRSLRAHQADR